MTKSEEQMRSEIQRIPVEHLENLGSVSEPQEVPPCDPFSSESPYKLAPESFTDEAKEKRLDSIAKAIITVDWKQVLEKK